MSTILALIHLHGWFWHPLDEGAGSTCSATNHTGCGYAGWSGILSDLGEYTIAVSLVAALVGAYRRHNCHVHRCWRLSWHAHPDHGHPVCAVHHPEGHRGLLWRIVHRVRLDGARPRVLSPEKHRYGHL